MLGTTKNARGLRCTAQGDCLRAQHKPRCVDTAAGTNQATIVAIMRAARVARQVVVATAYTTMLGEAGLREALAQRDEAIERLNAELAAARRAGPAAAASGEEEAAARPAR